VQRLWNNFDADRCVTERLGVDVHRTFAPGRDADVSAAPADNLRIA
jgi:hypothetical protein